MTVKFKRRYFVRQHDAMQCGVACLAMICRYLGKKISLAQLGAYCSTTNQGISMKGIGDAAAAIGLRSKGARLSAEDLAACPVPCIIYWKQRHFVVFLGEKSGRYHIADPAKGIYKLSEEEFLANWLSTSRDGRELGVAMFFEPGDDFDTLCPDEPVSPRRSFSFLFGYLHQYRRYLLQIALGMGLGCLLEIILPLMTQGIVDLGIHNRSIRLVWLILIGELVIVIGKTSTDFIRRWILLHISMRINISLLSDFLIKLLRLPMAYFDTKQLGDILQRMSDHSRVQSFLTQQCLGILFSVITFVVFSVMLCFYNPFIFGVFLVCSIIYSVWVCLFLHRRKLLDYELFSASANSQNKTYQFITAMQEIKLQNCGRRRRWEWEDTQADLFMVQMKSLKLQQTQEAGSVFINELKNILITVLAATAVIQGELTLGAMMAMQYIIGQLNSPVSQFVSFAYTLQDVKISLERINEIHDSEEEVAAAALEVRETDGKALIMRNVDFKYDRHANKNILDNICLTIEPDKFTAIVGASGSGKTTLVKLLLGYYRPTAGNIVLGETDLSAFDMDDWRSRCGAVMQDGVIFSESIARNIAVDDGEIDTDRMRQAAQKACIDSFITSLPLGYDTNIGPEGIGLSQGQKQRILIARAIYRNPEFIFFDEATNALDAENERYIVENLDEFYRGRTVVVVAHRLSTVKNADSIVVLDKGRIVEQGSHSELTARKGAYYNLIKNQLELGL